jgi:hypothetical protein
MPIGVQDLTCPPIQQRDESHGRNEAVQDEGCECHLLQGGVLS